jgi:hypothetical protein
VLFDERGVEEVLLDDVGDSPHAENLTRGEHIVECPEIFDARPVGRENRVVTGDAP